MISETLQNCNSRKEYLPADSERRYHNIADLKSIHFRTNLDHGTGELMTHDEVASAIFSSTVEMQITAKHQLTGSLLHNIKYKHTFRKDQKAGPLQSYPHHPQ